MNSLAAVGSLKDRLLNAWFITRCLFGDIFGFGIVSETMEIYTDGWDEANRLMDALGQIADCETSGANATVKRMAKIANDALLGG
jgi:hypothetical protein